MARLERILQIRVVCAQPEELLSDLAKNNIQIWDIQFRDPLTVEFAIKKIQLLHAEVLFKNNAASWKITNRTGVIDLCKQYLKRPVLIAGIVLFVIIVFALPGRVLMVRVIGNTKIPANYILSQAENCGIRFGARTLYVRSEEIKNQLLAKIPGLQWVGITTEGCVAKIQVTERSKESENENNEPKVAHIVAANDGVITEMTVNRGTPLATVGQSVNEGDILISGYTDCGIKLRAEQADGEVFAYTIRENDFITLSPSQIRGRLIETKACYGLRIGKKVINLCNHSGIPDTSCVKMYSEDYWTFPGEFQLPISFITIRSCYYEMIAVDADENVDFDWMVRAAESYAGHQMTAGQILKKDYLWNYSASHCCLTGTFACREMIGQIKYEEIAE